MSTAFLTHAEVLVSFISVSFKRALGVISSRMVCSRAAVALRRGLDKAPVLRVVAVSVAFTMILMV